MSNFKEIKENALSAYSSYKKASSDWNINRGKLQKAIKDHLDEVNKEICTQHNMEKQSLFNVSLDGGSATLNWDLNDNIWFSSFQIKVNDEWVLYRATINDSWLIDDGTHDNQIAYIEIDDKNSPLKFVTIRSKIQEIKKDLDIVATIYKKEIDYPYSRVTLIDGSVIEPVKTEESDYGSCCD